MKISKKSKFIPTHSDEKTWHIIVGISQKNTIIKSNYQIHPLQYIHIWNYGFVEEYELSKMPILYIGVLTRYKKQKIKVYVVEHYKYKIKTNPTIFLFDKTIGNDVWECLYFTKQFQYCKNKFVETTDCKVIIKNLFYSLIGCMEDTLK